MSIQLIAIDHKITKKKFLLQFLTNYISTIILTPFKYLQWKHSRLLCLDLSVQGYAQNKILINNVIFVKSCLVSVSIASTMNFIIISAMCRQTNIGFKKHKYNEWMWRRNVCLKNEIAFLSVFIWAQNETIWETLNLLLPFLILITMHQLNNKIHDLNLCSLDSF